MANKIVTKDSLQDLIDGPKVIDVIGRGLVALFKRQTDSERTSNQTDTNNNIGFTAGDALSGSITAKYYLKNRTLLDWQIEKWTKKDKRGYSRLAKYHRQLNEVANKKRQSK